MSGPSTPVAATLLVVDDVTANLRVVVEYLESNGFRAIVAQDGAEALRRAERVMPDLILLDVRMPGADGFEVCRKLKSDPRTKDIPILFMSSLTDTHDKVEGFAAGAADYLTKPIHLEEMRARVNAHLRVRTLQAQLQAQNAKLLAANQELQAFAYSVSHDLRAPLRGITGFAQLLREDHGASLNEDGLACVDRIQASSARMMALIDDLLRYAGTGATAVRSEPVSLDAILEQILPLFEKRIASSGANLQIARPLASPLGDPTLIAQILQNLIDNALTYRQPSGTPEIAISTVQSKGQVTVRVRDNGIGIAHEYQEKIFEVFQRLHSASEYPGTGIGLAIVAKAAGLMGGRVGVESVPGEGSTFSIYLPAADGASAGTSAHG